MAATSPTYAAALLSPRESLAKALAELRWLPEPERPAVVVCVLDAQHDGDVESTEAWDAIIENIGVDVVIAPICETCSRVHRNWAGQRVLLASSGDPRGRHITKINVGFEIADGGWKGSMVKNFTIDHADLDCTVAPDTATEDLVADFKADSAFEDAMSATLEVGSAAITAAITLSTACGEGQCTVGSVASDAMRWLTGAQVALLGSASIQSNRSSLDAAVANDDAGTAADVTRKVLAQVYPESDEVVLLAGVEGSCIESIISTGLGASGFARSVTEVDAGVAQVSNNVRINWHVQSGKVLVSKIEIGRASAGTDTSMFSKNILEGSFEAWDTLNSTAVYNVATTASIAETHNACSSSMLSSSGGGDNNAAAKNVGRVATYRGVVVAEAVAMYLEHEPSAIAMVLSAEARGYHRLQQTPEVLVLQLGSMCSLESATNLEECHQVDHIARLINDKTDGFYDHLLPTAFIDVKMADSKCAVGKAKAALDQMRTEFASDYNMEKEDTLYAVIGPFCSDDVADITNATYRAEIGWNGVTISGGSTSPALGTTEAQDAAHPYLARTATPETHVANGLVAIMQQYSWTKVAVVSDDSLWGSGAAQAFREGVLETIPNSEILVVSEIVLSAWDAALATPGPNAALEVLATAMLQTLEDAGAKIIYLAANSRIMREIFRYIYRTKITYGAGFVWFTAWVSEGTLTESDGGPCADCLHGAEGVLGLLEGAKSRSPGQDKVAVPYWRKHSSIENCVVPENWEARYNNEWEAKYAFDHDVENAFCDSDDDETTLGGYALNAVDAVMAYAQAMTEHLEVNPDDVNNPDVLYAKMKAMFVSGNQYFSSSESTLLLDEYGDKLGNFRVANLQINHGTLGGDSRVRGRGRRAVLLDATSAEFVVVGEYSTDPAQGLSLNEPAEGSCLTADGEPVALFPGGDCVAPPDVDPPVGFPKAATVAIVVIVVLVIVGFAVLRWHHGKQVGNLKAELQKLSKSLVGVRHVKMDFAGVGGGRPRAASYTATVGGAATSPSASLKPDNQTRWYWQEGSDRIDSHNKHDVLQPGNWVSYAWSVCAELDSAYAKWQSGKGVGSHTIDLTNRISSTGIEAKAHGADTGVGFVVDFQQMTQKNLKSNFVRPIHRVELEIASAFDEPFNVGGAESGFVLPNNDAYLAVGGSEGAGTTNLPGFGGMPQVDSGAPVLPADLVGNDNKVLIMTVGQLVQQHTVRKDGWAHGTILFDASGTDKSTTPLIDGYDYENGWFPIKYTEIASEKHLAQLQAKMGAGAVAALEPPSHWKSVRDPLVAERIELHDGPEKTECINWFKRSLSSSTQVVSVQRIQNMAMWQSYAVKRQAMSNRDKQSPEQAEKRWLFHGTSADTVPKIIQQGFNRGFAGKNATAYGRGVYFAKNSSYSASTT